MDDMQIIVCGPNRSGTSLMMRCLEKAGFKMDDDLIPGDIGNIYGYYESRRFKAECHKITMSREPGIEGFRRLLDKKGRWAWKYPKSVFMLNVIFAATKNMFVIYMDRPKNDVIKSMIRHAELKNVAPTLKEYSLFYNGSLRAINAYEHRKLKVSFIDLVKDEKKIMNEVLEFLGLEANYNYTAVDIEEVHFMEESEK